MKLAYFTLEENLPKMLKANLSRALSKISGGALKNVLVQDDTGRVGDIAEVVYDGMLDCIMIKTKYNEPVVSEVNDRSA